MLKRPQRRFSQHFLESSWVDRVIRIVEPAPADTFLEIGSGRGALTLALARTGARIIAVEIDQDLVTQLRHDAPSNVTIVSGDFLALDLDRVDKLPDNPLRAVGNLPYSVSAPILLKLLRFSDHGARVRDAVLMFQREVADRVTAEPGTRNWGPLAVAVRLHAQSRIALTIPAGAFRPIPKVQSALVTLRFCPAPVTVRDPHLLDQVVRSIFSQRRKTAVNSLRPLVSQISTLAADVVFERAGIDPRMRPEQLKLSELAELSDVLANSRL
jgi:16S rRNA (adenine1518-N6/adenine1519-N6)-dimethyltransferase